MREPLSRLVYGRRILECWLEREHLDVWEEWQDSGLWMYLEVWDWLEQEYLDVLEEFASVARAEYRRSLGIKAEANR